MSVHNIQICDREHDYFVEGMPSCYIMNPMLQTDTGTLNVYSMTSGALKTGQKPVWSLSGNQGNMWKPARVTVQAALSWQV